MRPTLLGLALLAGAAAPALAQTTIINPPDDPRVVVHRPPRIETKAAPADDEERAGTRKPRVERPVFIPPQHRAFDEPTVSDSGASLVPPMFDTFSNRENRDRDRERHRRAVAGGPPTHHGGFGGGMWGGGTGFGMGGRR